MTTFTDDEYHWNGLPLRGLCRFCGVIIDNTDPNHRITSILAGGRGVECVLRGDIDPSEGGPIR
jgi:hypothetical protein